MIGTEESRFTVQEIKILRDKIKFSLPLNLQLDLINGKRVEAPYEDTFILVQLSTGNTLKGARRTDRLNLNYNGIAYQFDCGIASLNGTDEPYTRSLKTTKNGRRIQHTQNVTYEEYQKLIKGFPTYRH